MNLAEPCVRYSFMVSVSAFCTRAPMQARITVILRTFYSVAYCALFVCSVMECISSMSSVVVHSCYQRTCFFNCPSFEAVRVTNMLLTINSTSNSWPLLTVVTNKPLLLSQFSGANHSFRMSSEVVHVITTPGLCDHGIDRIGAHGIVESGVPEHFPLVAHIERTCWNSLFSAPTGFADSDTLPFDRPHVPIWYGVPVKTTCPAPPT